jgi:hypothetical protein
MSRVLSRVLPVLVAAVLLAPHVTDAAVSVEGFYGITRPRATDFSAAASSASHDPHLIRDSLNIAGGDLILHLGVLELGAIMDTSWKSGSASQTAIGGLIGVGTDLEKVLRLELLGEVGGQRYGNFFENSDVVTSSSKSEWLAYVGVRPGIAWRFDLGRDGGPGLLVGVWGFIRWDLTSKTVPVTAASASATPVGSIDLGGTTIGAVARLGLDF